PGDGRHDSGAAKPGRIERARAEHGEGAEVVTEAHRPGKPRIARVIAGRGPRRRDRCLITAEIYWPRAAVGFAGASTTPRAWNRSRQFRPRSRNTPSIRRSRKSLRRPLAVAWAGRSRSRSAWSARWPAPSFMS